MSEWWTYSLSDFLLFSPRTYYRLFELYNLAVWPWHLLALAIGIAILAMWLHGGASSGHFAAVVLAGCWLWVAWAYLWGRYDTINWAASYFAAGFAVEALLLAWSGLVRNGLRPRPLQDAAGAAGLGIFLVALIAWPLIGPLAGRPWTQIELFGIVPDPTVAATLGIVVAAERMRRHLLLIPLAWSAISGATLWAMQSPEAWLLPAAALLTLALAAWTTARTPPPERNAPPR